MRLRYGTAADSAACAALFTAAVHQLASSHYNPQQCEAWAPLKPDVTRWQKHLGSLELLLAEDAQRLLGFIGYAHDGHIDLLYCAPRAARCTQWRGQHTLPGSRAAPCRARRDEAVYRSQHAGEAILSPAGLQRDCTGRSAARRRGNATALSHAKNTGLRWQAAWHCYQRTAIFVPSGLRE